ncbi:MAG: domain S-box protein [Chloroflexi bacterium]|nr:domain S-box protein [Chloroflexota bacterium]
MGILNNAFDDKNATTQSEIERLRSRIYELEQENYWLKQNHFVTDSEESFTILSGENIHKKLNTLYQTVMHANAVIAIMRGPEHIFELANPLHLQVLGRDSSIIGLPIREALPELEGQGHIEILDEVYRSGQPFTAHEMPVMLARKKEAPLERVLFTFIYYPLFNFKNEVDGIFVHALEVTEQVKTREDLLHERQRLQEIFMNAPAAIAVLREPQHIFELANENFHKLVGRKTPITGYPVVDALPEIKNQGFIELLDNIYRTGEAFSGFEMPAKLDRLGNGSLDQAYVNFIFQPLLSPGATKVEGIFVHAVEVTEQVLARHQLEKLIDEQRQQKEVVELAHRTAKIGTFQFFVEEDRILWSPELEVLYGLEPGGFEGNYQNWTKRVHPADLGKVESSLWEAVNNGQAYNIEFRIIWPDGTERWVQAKGDTDFANKGKVYRVIGVNIDITERKQVEEALRNSEERFKRVAQATNDAIWDWNLVTNKIWWSDGVQKLFGYLPEQIGDDSNWWHNHIHPEDHERVTNNINLIINNVTKKNEWSEEYRYLCVDGTYLEVLDRGYVIRDPITGKAVRMLGAMVNITERKALDQLKDAFLGIASHELKTPLTSIKGFAQKAGRDLSALQFKIQEAANPSTLESNEDVKLNLQKMADSINRISRSIHVVNQQITRMSELTNRLLDVTRLQQGTLELNYSPAPVNLVRIIEQEVETLSISVLDHLLLLNITTADLEDGVFLRLDENRIIQVLTNLITNAIKYSPSNTTVTIGLTRRGTLPPEEANRSSSQAEQDQIVVWIKDEGYGLSPQQQRHLFERFYRVRTSQNQRVEGLGLGLYISNEIVTLHGGQLWVVSEEGRGSTFYFSLPQNQE